MFFSLFPYPLVTQTSDVHLHEVTSRLTGNLKDSLGLACARSTVEQADKALTHTLFFESLLDRGQALGAKQTGETVNLLFLTSSMRHPNHLLWYPFRTIA